MNSRILILAVGVGVATFVIGVLIASVFNPSGGQIGRAVHTELGLFDTAQRQAPTFDLIDIRGQQVSLESLRGKVVMVGFWSSWCVECRLEADELATAYLKWRDRGVEFIGIAIWDSPEDVADFVERYGIEFPVVAHTGVLQVDYGVTGIPEKFFISSDGTLIKRIIGPINGETLDSILEDLV